MNRSDADELIQSLSSDIERKNCGTSESDMNSVVVKYGLKVVRFDIIRSNNVGKYGILFQDIDNNCRFYLSKDIWFDLT